MSFSSIYNDLKTTTKFTLLNYLKDPETTYNTNMSYINKIKEDKGDEVRCNIHAMRVYNRFENPNNQKCIDTKLTKNSTNIKKIGAESANGIVFLIEYGSGINFVVKTALVDDADPLDYEYHIQNKLNPLRKYIPNYSLGYFPFICPFSEGLFDKKTIGSIALPILEELWDSNKPSSTSLQKKRKGLIKSKKNSSVEFPYTKGDEYNFNLLFKREVDRINLTSTKQKRARAIYKLYNEIMNTFDDINYGKLCIRPISSARRIPAHKTGFFIATEHTDVYADLADFIIKKKYTQEGEIINILLQVFCALQVGINENNFTHYDLHSGNVLLTKLKNPIILLYDFGNKIIPVYTKYIATLIDFGRSYVDGKRMNFSKEKKSDSKPDYGIAEWSADWNITPNKSNPCYDMLRVFMAVYADLHDSNVDLKKMNRFNDIAKVIANDFEGYLHTTYPPGRATTMVTKLNAFKKAVAIAHPYNSGHTIKNPLDFIQKLYGLKSKKGGSLCGRIHLGKEQIYLVNSRIVKNGEITNMNSETLDALQEDLLNNDLDRMENYRRNFLIGGRRRKVASRKRKIKKGGGIVFDKYETIDNKSIYDQLKGIRKKMYILQVPKEPIVFENQKLGRSGGKRRRPTKSIKKKRGIPKKSVKKKMGRPKKSVKKKMGRPKKSTNGGININHDVKLSLERIQQI